MKYNDDAALVVVQLDGSADAHEVHAAQWWR